MPRGFLVKRYSNQLPTDCSPTSQSLQHANCVPLPLTSRPLIRYRYSDEDRSESSSSEQEAASVTSIPSPISHESSDPLVPLALSPPLLSYSQRFSSAEVSLMHKLLLLKCFAM